MAVWDFYADFDVSGGSNLGTLAQPWETLADVLAGTNGTAPAAGESVGCKGTDGITSTVTVSLDGTSSGGYIKFIGVDSNWDNVGGTTLTIIDGQTNTLDCLTFIGATFLWFENFDIKNAGSSGTTNDGIYGATTNNNYNVFINIHTHDCKGDGISGNLYLKRSLFFRCSSYNNSQYGFANYQESTLIACRAYNNTSYGYRTLEDNVHLGCISNDNSTGFFLYQSHGLINCIADGNTGSGFYVDTAGTTLHYCGCRSTNNGTGINTSAALLVLLIYYYGDNNTTDVTNYYEEIIGMTLNGSDTDEGYVNQANNNYNLTDDATYRREPIVIP